MSKEMVPPLLARILTTKRAHGSAGEQQFRLWLMATLRNMKEEPRVMEENIVVTVGTGSKILFSSHIDTVHSQAASDGSQQKLAYDKSFGHLFLDKDSKGYGNCLGADDGAGVYLMLRMIAAKVEGTYCFHVGEERGGIGSGNMRAKQPKFLEGFTHAVAFDRAGTSDVIYKQGGTQCASMECAEAIAKALNIANTTFEFQPSDRGTFTDTKLYAGIIPECLNISVGYMDQHGDNESLDVGFLEDLVDACIAIKWEALPVKRKPVVGDFYSSKKTAAPGGFSFQPPPKSNPKPPTTMYVPALKELEGLNLQELQEVAVDDPDLMVRVFVLLQAKVRGLEAKVDALEDFFN